MSNDYWRERELIQALKNITDEKEYSKKVQLIYLQMLDEVQKEINNFFYKYAIDNNLSLSEVKKKASKLDIQAYSRKAKKYVKEKNFSKKANEEMKLYNMTMKVNRLELLKANIGLELVDGHNELESYIGELLTDKAIATFKRQSGILGKTVINNAKMVDSIVNASFHNATYSDRIWMHQELLKHDLEKLLSTALIQGKNGNELAPQLKKAFNVKSSDAKRLLNTELARVQIDVQKKEYEMYGIEKYEYIACGNGDVCQVCKALDYKVFNVKDMEIGENAPPMHPNCHCAIGPYVED